MNYIVNRSITWCIDTATSIVSRFVYTSSHYLPHWAISIKTLAAVAGLWVIFQGIQYRFWVAKDPVTGNSLFTWEGFGTYLWTIVPMPGRVDWVPMQYNQKDSKGEQLTKKIVEDITGREFTKVRLDSMRNPITQFPLELDCYNADLGVAVEYDGEQHFRYIPFFHSSKAVFHNQKYRDYVKEQLCRENGIKLVRVPFYMPKSQIYAHIQSSIGASV